MNWLAYIAGVLSCAVFLGGYALAGDTTEGAGDLTDSGLPLAGGTITGTLTVNGAVDFDSSFTLDNNQQFVFGTSAGFLMQPQGGLDQFTFLVGDNVAGNQIVLGNSGCAGQDFDHALTTNPTFFVHSDTCPDTANDEWVSITHDQTDVVIDAGSGDIKIEDEVEVVGVSGDGSGKAVCVKSDGNLGTCSTAPNGSGVCTCG